MIQVPKNPITIKINGWLIEYYLRSFASKYLPEYDLQITSGYRSPGEQAALREKGFSAAVDSAHLYNLARDFVILKDGKILSDTEMEKVFKDRFPYWEGYSYFNPKTALTSTGWIHANIERELTRYTMYLGIAGSAVLAGVAVSNLLQNYLPKTKGKTDGKENQF